MSRHRRGIRRLLGCMLAGLVLVLMTGALTASAAGSKKKRRKRRPKPKPKPAVTEETVGGEETGGGGGGGGREPYEGFGVSRGGSGGKEVRVSSASQLGSALRQKNVIVRLAKGNYSVRELSITGGNMTFDGGGATLTGGGGRGGILNVFAHNVIVRNVRIRKGYDNITTGNSSHKGVTRKVLFSHVTVSGARDDGMSIAYGCSDITIQYCALLGNSRNCFIKYGGTNVSVHHNLFSHQWIRGVLANKALVDYRNNVQQKYSMWGCRFEGGATGNAINNTIILGNGGKSNSAIYARGAGKVCFKGNVGKNGAKPESTGGSEIQVPKVTTHSAAESERIVMQKAGCLPRDSIDKQILSSRKSAGNGRGLP